MTSQYRNDRDRPVGWADVPFTENKKLVIVLHSSDKEAFLCAISVSSGDRCVWDCVYSVVTGNHSEANIKPILTRYHRDRRRRFQKSNCIGVIHGWCQYNESATGRRALSRRRQALHHQEELFESSTKHWKVKLVSVIYSHYDIKTTN